MMQKKLFILFFCLFVIVLSALVSGCIFDKQDAPPVEPLDESVISSVDADVSSTDAA